MEGLWVKLKSSIWLACLHWDIQSDDSPRRRCPSPARCLREVLIVPPDRQNAPPPDVSPHPFLQWIDAIQHVHSDPFNHGIFEAAVLCAVQLPSKTPAAIRLWSVRLTACNRLRVFTWHSLCGFDLVSQALRDMDRRKLVPCAMLGCLQLVENHRRQYTTPWLVPRRWLSPRSRWLCRQAAPLATAARIRSPRLWYFFLCLAERAMKHCRSSRTCEKC